MGEALPGAVVVGRDSCPETSLVGSDVCMLFADELRGYTFGLPQVSWAEGRPNTTRDISRKAYELKAMDIAFFGDPAGPPKVGVESEPGVRYDDLAPGLGMADFLPFATDRPPPGGGPTHAWLEAGVATILPPYKEYFKTDAGEHVAVGDLFSDDHFKALTFALPDGSNPLAGKSREELAATTGLIAVVTSS